ncbi:MAG: ATP-binding protein [Verrucomicrobiae bacterium]|nr:ATP-binding protein [Verrucomicrobiae bacterium]
MKSAPSDFPRSRGKKSRLAGKKPSSRGKRLSSQLIQARKLETLGLLASGIAHDFNNLLTSIRGSLALALAETTPQHSAASHLLDAEKAAQCGVGMARQLMGYIRQSAAVPKNVHVRQHLRDTSSFVARLLPTGVQLRMELDLPENLGIRVVPSQLSQILMNLCINGAEAMSKGGDLVLGARSKGRQVEIFVSDCGCGMDKETLRDVFEPFVTTKGDDKGAGLGLATVRQLVAENRGKLRVKSEPGKGTCFRMFFSVTRAARTPASEKKLSLPSSPSAFGKGRTLLLVENDELVRHVNRKILTRAGYRLFEATDGMEAMEMVRQHGKDIEAIILDLNMPRKSGCEMMADLKKMGASIPVILASGFTVDLPGDELRKLGVNAVLTKPYLPAEFLAVIHRVLGG